QVYMRLLESDLLDTFQALIHKKLADAQVKFRHGFAVCVVLCSGGYPDAYETNFPIYGIDDAQKIKGVEVFHAGTKYVNGRYYTDGGRVLNVTAVGDTLSQAIEIAYEGVRCI